METSRLSHDFADPATLDAVVCSLFLFTAYNVLEKHGRAFLYLEEASSLLDAVLPANEKEALWKLRAQQVLFNTEAATNEIYGSRSRQRRGHRPSLRVNATPCAEDAMYNGFESVKVVPRLLKQLTEINMAEDADALERINVESEADADISFGDVLRQQRYFRIQAADVVITRQWQLSSKLLVNRGRGPATRQQSQQSIEQLGIVAMSWACLLGKGELRIVGLGKMTGLARNLSALLGPSKCRPVLLGLAGAVSREDFGKKFISSLAEVVTPMMSSIPTTLSFPNDGRSQQTSTRADLLSSPLQSDTRSLESSWHLGSDERADSCLPPWQEEQLHGRDEMDFDQFINL